MTDTYAGGDPASGSAPDHGARRVCVITSMPMTASAVRSIAAQEPHLILMEVTQPFRLSLHRIALLCQQFPSIDVVALLPTGTTVESLLTDCGASRTLFAPGGLAGLSREQLTLLIPGVRTTPPPQVAMTEAEELTATGQLRVLNRSDLDEALNVLNSITRLLRDRLPQQPYPSGPDDATALLRQVQMVQHRLEVMR